MNIQNKKIKKKKYYYPETQKRYRLKHKDKHKFIRIDSETLKLLTPFRKPINKIIFHRSLENYGHVVQRLLKKHWNAMMKEKEDFQKCQ